MKSILAFLGGMVIATLLIAIRLGWRKSDWKRRVPLIAFAICWIQLLNPTSHAAVLYPGGGGTGAAGVSNIINLYGRIGPGTTNQIAKFVNPTNVGDSILSETTSNYVDLVPGGGAGQTTSGALAAAYRVYGVLTNKTSGYQDLYMGWKVGDGAFEILAEVGSAVQLGQASALYIGSSNASWAWNYSGVFYPLVDNGYDLGGSSGRIKDVYVGTGGIIGTIGSTAALNYRMSGGGGWYETGDRIGFLGSNGAEYFRMQKSTPSVLDIGLSPLGAGRGAGAGVGAVDTYFVSPAVNVWQMGTNDQASGGSAPPTQRLQPSGSTGTDTPAATIQLAGGPPSGAGRAGDVVVITSTNGATGSAQRGFQTRTFISAHAVTLTESSATTVLTIALTAGQHCGVRVFATTTADDGTDYQSVAEEFVVAGVNKAATATASISASAPMATAVSSGTLTTTWTAVNNSGNIDVKCNAVSSLTQTTLATRWVIEANGNGPLTITAQ